MLIQFLKPCNSKIINTSVDECLTYFAKYILLKIETSLCLADFTHQHIQWFIRYKVHQ